MGEHNDAIVALAIAHTHPALQAFNEYLAAEKNARAAAEVCGADADLMIAEAEALAKATTFSSVEALGLVIDRTMNGKRAAGKEGRA